MVALAIAVLAMIFLFRQDRATLIARNFTEAKMEQIEALRATLAKAPVSADEGAAGAGRPLMQLQRLGRPSVAGGVRSFHGDELQERDVLERQGIVQAGIVGVVFRPAERTKVFHDRIAPGAGRYFMLVVVVLQRLIDNTAGSGVEIEAQ